ncbi:hypothetical protein [Devosia naphthalenivorans]|uniref:hypothetical protein n=1 Tax=Devosia naphthalenivorans TaxID=2082392 RepID=UPI000D3D5547|nr:hypothetical protein [Devosia naphthalenivorans]
MNLGYSILLGEFVPANQARPTDVAGFQIVCPCCKDPVFKTERLGRKDVLEFFSHYASKVGTEDCELRVAGISEGTRASTNSASRSQTLKLFLAVIRSAMAVAWKDDPHARRWAEVEGSPALSWFVDLRADHMATGRWFKDADLDEALDTAISDVDLMALRNAGGLDVSVRRRLVKDVISHLRSPNAAKNRKTLILHGLRGAVEAFWTCEALNEIDIPMRKMFNALLSDTRTDWRAWVKRMNERQGPHLDAFNDLHFMIEMFLMRDLLRLPVVRMLENHRAGRAVLEGIDDLDYLPIAHAKSDEISGPSI